MALEYGMTELEFEKMLESIVTEEFVVSGLKKMGIIPNFSIKFEEIQVEENKENNNYNFDEVFSGSSEKVDISYNHSERNNGVHNDYREDQILNFNNKIVKEHPNVDKNEISNVFAA